MKKMTKLLTNMLVEFDKSMDNYGSTRLLSFTK